MQSYLHYSFDDDKLAERQRAIDQARIERDRGIDRVVASTDRSDPTWVDVAYAFLAQYARKHSLINPEDVADEARKWGMSDPKDERAWGGVYRRAVKQDLILRTHLPYQRRKGHATLSFLWRSLAYQG